MNNYEPAMLLAFSEILSGAPDVPYVLGRRGPAKATKPSAHKKKKTKRKAKQKAQRRNRK